MPTAKKIRLYLTLAAGEDVNGTLFSHEYESPEALGAAFDALADNVELQALTARLNGPGSPTVITSQYVGIDLPLGRTPKAGRGSILEVHTSHINPGRFEDAIAESGEAPTGGARSRRSGAHSKSCPRTTWQWIPPRGTILNS